MPGQVVTYTGLLNSSTRDYPNDVVWDQFFQARPFFELLANGKRRKVISGGLFIREAFNYGKSSNGQFYSASNPGGWLTVPYNKTFTTGYNWVYYRNGVAMTGPEINENSNSDEAIFDMVDFRVSNMMLSCKDDLAVNLLLNNPYGNSLDGTVGNPMGYEGLAVQVSDSSYANSVGGQLRSAFPVLNSITNWANTLSSGLPATLQSLDAAANRAAESRVNVLLTNSVIYSYYASLLAVNERYTLDTRIQEQELGVKNSGQNNLAFNNCPIFYDTSMPSAVVNPTTGTGSGSFVFGLNMNTFKFKVSEMYNFKVGPWYADIYGDQYYKNLLSASAFYCVAPNKNFITFVSGG